MSESWLVEQFAWVSHPEKKSNSNSFLMEAYGDRMRSDLIQSHLDSASCAVIDALSPERVNDFSHFSSRRAS